MNNADPLVNEKILFTGTVLLIDDDAQFREILGRMLRSLGVEMLEAEESVSAIEILGKIPVDLIFLDIHLVLEDGIEILSQIIDRFPEVPVVMMTASSDREMVLSSMAHGAKDYLLKPVQKEGLQKKLGRWLVNSAPKKIPLGIVQDNRCTVKVDAQLIATNISSLQFQTSVKIRPNSEVRIEGVFTNYVYTDSHLCLPLNVHSVLNRDSVTLCEGSFGSISIEKRDQLQKLIETWKKHEVSSKKSIRSDETDQHNTICVLDDDPEFLVLIEKILRKLEYDVFTFRTPAELMTFIESHTVVACFIDLWIDRNAIGFEVIKSIRRKLGPEVALFVISGTNAQEVLADALQSGCDEYVTKQGDFDGLSASVEAVLHRVLIGRVDLERQLYVLQEGFSKAVLHLEVVITHADRHGIEFWCEHLIRKGTPIALDKSIFAKNSRLSTTLISPIELQVMRAKVGVYEGREGFYLSAEPYLGVEASEAKFKGFIDRISES